MLTSELIKVLEAKLKKDGDLPVFIQKEYGTPCLDKHRIFTCSASNPLPRRIVIV